MDVNSIDGPAFHTANDILNDMKKEGREGWLRIAIQSGSDAQPLLDTSLVLLSAHTRSWTDRQRELVWAVEHYADQQKVVAHKFSISAAAISKQLKAADYSAYKQTFKAMEQYLHSLDVRVEESEIQGFTSLLNIGRKKKSQSEYRSALVYFMRSLKRAEIELGSEHPYLASIHCKMAEMHIELEHYDKAEDTLNQALQVLSSQPRGYPEKARIINALAYTKILMTQYKAAEDCFSEALSICSYNLGLNHPVAAEIYSNIAILYLRRGEYSEALQSYAHVLTIYEKILGADHIRIAEICGLVSDIYVTMNDWEKAAVFGRKALKIFENRSGTRHPDTVSASGRISKLQDLHRT
jgi:tetratricopeptide (TPR) repeat protein